MNGTLKIIATFSVGYDHIDIKAAKEKLEVQMSRDE